MIKSENGQPPQPTNEILKAKLASEIIKESGIARQNNSLTEAVLSSFEEKYKEADAIKKSTDDQKLFPVQRRYQAGDESGKNK